MSAGSVVIFADCKNFVDKYNKGCGLQDPFGVHGDLWYELRQVIDQRKAQGYSTEVGKVKAHLEEQHVLEGTIKLADYAGNTYADQLAGWAAGKAAVPEVQRVLLAHSEDTAWLILHRMVVITERVFGAPFLEKEKKGG